MNIRVDKVRSKDGKKTYKYVRILRSYRKKGKSTNKVIANLGELPPLAVKNLKLALAANRQGKAVVIVESDSGDHEYSYDFPMSLQITKVPDRKKTKVYQYARLVRSYRKDGKSTHDIIGNLGRLPPLAIKNLRCALEANRQGRIVEFAE